MTGDRVVSCRESTMVNEVGDKRKNKIMCVCRTYNFKLINFGIPVTLQVYSDDVYKSQIVERAVMLNPMEAINEDNSMK